MRIFAAANPLAMTASTTHSGTASSLADRAAAEMTYTQHSAKMRDFCDGFFEPAAPQGCCSPLRYRKDSPNLCFTFTGKERDAETGYGYFGARYMDHELMTSWLSVDPMSDKYPSISPYAYCNWNPVRLVDPDGREVGNYYSEDGTYLGTDNIADGKVYIVPSEDAQKKVKNGNFSLVMFKK